MTWGCRSENYPAGCGWAKRLTYPSMGHEEWWCDTCERSGDFGSHGTLARIAATRNDVDPTRPIPSVVTEETP